MDCKVRKKYSYFAHLRECFFSFADNAKEEHFVRLAIEQRKFVISLLGGALCAASALKILGSEDMRQNLVGFFLLDPTTPGPIAFLLVALLMGRWQWVEPAVFVAILMRMVSLRTWIVCDPASIPAVVQRWLGPFSSMHSFIICSVMVSASSFVLNARLKFALFNAVLNGVMAPGIAHRSPADLSPWPLVVAMVVTVLLRLHLELKSRSKFLDLYYPTNESTVAGIAAGTTGATVAAARQDVGGSGCTEQAKADQQADVPLQQADLPLRQAEATDSTTEPSPTESALEFTTESITNECSTDTVAPFENSMTAGESTSSSSPGQPMVASGPKPSPLMEHLGPGIPSLRSASRKERFRINRGRHTSVVLMFGRFLPPAAFMALVFLGTSGMSRWLFAIPFVFDLLVLLLSSLLKRSPQQHVNLSST
eukprot:gene24471-10075_t